MISASGEVRCPVWKTQLGTSTSAGELVDLSVARGCARESGEWAVLLRAAQLLAEGSWSGRRSVAPLGALLTFGEIVRWRSRVRPSGAPRSTEWNPVSHARPRRGSCVPTHLLSSLIAARARPHHHDSRVTPRSTQAGLFVGSRPRDFARGPMAGGSGVALPKQSGSFAGQPRPRGLVFAQGEGPRRPASSISLSLAGHRPR
jgi:hypothetical protein